MDIVLAVSAAVFVKDDRILPELAVVFVALEVLLSLQVRSRLLLSHSGSFPFSSFFVLVHSGNGIDEEGAVVTFCFFFRLGDDNAVGK